MHLIGLILVPLAICIAGAALWPKRITWKEMLIGMGIGVVVALAGFYIARYAALSDTEHWNGRISAKTHGSQPCCHCRDVCDSRDKNGNCTSSHEVCSHLQDYWWSLEVNTGDTIPIDYCEPNENTVPASWTAAYVGEPAAVKHRYLNYLRADPDSLVRKFADEKMLNSVPEFPLIYDFYKVSKVVGGGLPPEWDKGLREINADFGNSKQVDVTLVVTNNPSPTWADALEAAWLYGPKNSLNIVVGITKDGVFDWVRVVTISKVEDVKIGLRDGLKGLKTTDWEQGLKIIRSEVSKFHRTPMAEYEYLMSAASPSTGVLIFLYIFITLASCGLVWWAHGHDIFGNEGFGFGWCNHYNRRKW